MWFIQSISTINVVVDFRRVKEKCVQYACRYTGQTKVTEHIKDLRTAMLTGPTSFGKSHLVLDLIEKEYIRHFYCIIIFCPTFHWKKKNQTKDLIIHNDNVWLIEKNDKLSQWVDNLSLLLALSEVLMKSSMISWLTNIFDKSPAGMVIISSGWPYDIIWLYQRI